ncbi:MAG: efflux RND transporter periplasmic adaptor subunit [Bacteroidaceae bacterium]|nr:efflux RND transporter periplasmic adaptor subunit [Bacteroidaceae bacterium]
MNKKSILGVLVVGTLVLSGCDQSGKIREALAARAGQAKPYKTMKVAEGTRELETTYSASIQGRQDINILPLVGGTLQEVLVTEGQRVSKGQSMFIIDQVPYKAALATAEANLKAAEAGLATANLTLSSKKTLREQGVISEYELLTAQNSQLTAAAAVEQAKAAVTNARNSLNYTVVKSPANGVVGTLPYRQGALVSSAMAQPLTTVSDNNEMYVYFSMNENQILSLSRKFGSREAAIKNFPTVKLRLSDGSVYETEGRVETISGVVDKTTGSVSLRAVFANPNHILQSGASGAVIIPEVYENMIVIPQSAVFQRQDKYYVYKVTQTKEDVDIYAADGTKSRGKAWVANGALIKVMPGNNGKEYIVTSGLTAGEEIIAEGAGMAREGDQVQK